MRILAISLVLTSTALLASCERPASQSTSHHGRYLGVGIYAAGPGWANMDVAPAHNMPPASTNKHDEHVIVVVDSDTGEVRQCGDLSGYCVSMKPWHKEPWAETPVGVPVTPPDPATVRPKYSF